MVDYEIALSLPATGKIASEDQIHIATQADELGYDALLAPESWGREVFSRLGFIAARTERIRLGTGIVPIHSRSPALLAQSIATLDELSEGRALLGIGVSGPRVIESWHGETFEPALRRQRETIEIVRAVLSGENVEYDGRVFDLSGFRLRFEPRRSSIPIYVAAQGETNIELVGGFGDGWMPNRIPVSALPDVRRHVERGARMRDRDPDEIATVPFVATCVLEDGTAARARCREMIAFYLGAMGEYHFNAVADHGFRDVAKSVKNAWQAGDYDAARELVSDELLSEIAITGTPDEARSSLEAYEGIADTVVLLPPTTASIEEIEETIEHVGRLAFD